MKKALVVVAVLALLLWVVSWFRAPAAVATSVAKPWPGKMGPLKNAADRVPNLQANEASRKLTALAGTLPKNTLVEEFVAREVARGEQRIGEPPVLPEMSPIRELLLREPIVWTRHEGIGGDNDTQAARGVQMNVARALAASALARARVYDPGAWEDLRAVWKLARSLDGHPQMLVQTAALSMGRMINAVAWKMPLPAPDWIAEVHERDNVQPLLEAFQYQTASYANDGSSLFPTKMLAASVDHDRRIAEDLYRATACDVNPPMNELGVDLTSVWRRAFRYRAEREASANALRIREGKPIDAHSRCSDGGWTLDGTTLRFTHDIATPAPDRPMPLVLKVSGPEHRTGA